MHPETIDIQAVIDASRQGGAILRNYFGQVLDTTRKSTLADVRTKADLESEEAVIKVLNAAFPTFNIFAEEQGEISRGSDYTFVIDPLDGTNNFVLGIPNFSVSIGLLYQDTIVAGVIHLPLLDQTFHAQKGQGAFMNGAPIRVSTVSDPGNSTFAHGCNYHTSNEVLAKLYQKLFLMDRKRIISNWSPTFDFCLLAGGKIEGVINDGTELYDFSAGKLIALEAGARLTTFSNQQPTNDRETVFLMSNGQDTIHEHLVEVVK